MATPDAPQLSESQYAVQRKELLALMSQLRSVGAQGELDLPRITVIGNQSAGNIKVPRDAGTCTRCPMECRLSSSNSAWSCRISIRLEFDNAGRQLQDVSEQRFGEMITDKNKVEVALRRAQLAVLNPGVGFAEILEMDEEQLRKGIPNHEPLLFSRNVVCVDLEGPDLTDLYFLDLPGIIQNAEPHIVQLVEEMVVSHIRGHCLILVALPMTDDIENQKALRLAHQVDPEGRRTIGVMTKPDMLSAGSTKARDLWLDVIEGRRHVLHHGYYCRLRRRSSARLPPGRTSSHKDRFGTANLISTLSTLLVQVINDRLPLIRQMANERMEACRRELSALPDKVVGEPATHMLNLITATSTVQSDMSALIHERNAAFAAFKQAIRKTQPNFIARAPGQTGNPVIYVIDDDDAVTAEDLISTQKAHNLNDVRDHIARSVTRELPGNIPFSAKKSLITAFQQTWLASAAECFDSVKQSMLALLMRKIDEMFGRYEVLHSRLKDCVTRFASRYYDSCGDFLMAILEVEQMPFTMNDHYLQSATGQMAGALQRAASREDRKRRKINSNQPTATTSKPAEPLPPDANPPFQAGFGGFKVPLPQPEVSSPAAPTSASDPEKINGILAQLAELGYPGLTADDFGKLRPVDEYETEIAVMAEVRGYFQRVIDNIPALIDSKFLRALTRTLQQDLISEFGLGGVNANAVCAAFLAEDPRLVARRDDLIARRRRLESVQAELHNFGLHSAARDT
ncbi:P-loop containing nucleoside triphosphate hydrolase protein [Mycena rebaudengoi]|nr:P-loop containing nucleoside triphosphate hydrolase protein [Mycena rebaudengoi]